MDKSLNNYSVRIKDYFIQSSLSSFQIFIDGKIAWEKNVIGCFIKGKKLFEPKITIFLDGYFMQFEKQIRNKLEQFLDFLKK